MNHSIPTRGVWLLPIVALAGSAILSINAFSQDADPVLITHPDDEQGAGAAQALVTGQADTDAKGRHLAPHDTFYLLSYVAAKTDKGVDGFAPGQEVHLVEVHRPTQTLVVTDGHVQVEVAPSKLTNDIDLAELVRNKDQNSQARINAYIQAEEEAYKRESVKVAEDTNKDLARREEKQADDARKAEQARAAAQPAAQVNALSDNGYYGSGGYGYGSPYSYFSGGNVNIIPQTPAAAPAANVPSKVAAPGGGAAVRPR